VDVAPTLLELAGLKVPSAMQGRSLVSLLTDKTPGDWRKSQFYTYWGAPNHYGIRTKRYTYLKLAGHEPELFDRRLDHGQTNNVAEDPERKSVLQSLERELQRQIKQVDINESELPTQVKAPSKTRASKRKKKSPPND